MDKLGDLRSTDDPTAVGCLPGGQVTSVDTERVVESADFKERFGRYLLIEPLGRGGMAEVFKAVAEGAQGFRRVFVVKRILPQFANSPYFVSLFADEAKLSAMLHHPNLVQVYEFGAVSGIHYLSMEYLDGLDLATVLARLALQGEQLAPSSAAFIAQQIAHGLAYAHAATDDDGNPLHLVHRDVSPENIMLLEAGTVKLFDFGIALSDQRLTSSVTQGKVLKGKLGYTSPEQVTGRPLDGRSDIFSLGVVMWEMLTGRRLFVGEDDARTLYNVLERPITPPSQIAPGVPRAFDAVVLRALARNPADRYPTADALAEDLDEVLRVLPHHRTHLPAVLERTGKSHARDRRSATGATPIVEYSLTAETISHAHLLRVTKPLQQQPEPNESTTPNEPNTVLFPLVELAPAWTAPSGRMPTALRAAGAFVAAFCLLFATRALVPSPQVSPQIAMPIPAPLPAPVSTAPEMTPLPPTPAPSSVEVAVIADEPPSLPTANEEIQQDTARSETKRKPRVGQLALAPRKPVHQTVKAAPKSLTVKSTPTFKNTADLLDQLHVDPFAN